MSREELLSIHMLKFNQIRTGCIVSVVILLLLTKTSFANQSLMNKNLQSSQQYCLVETDQIKFCSTQNLSGKIIISKLPLFVPVKLSNGETAFRLMATITNQTGKTIIGAKVEAWFDTDGKAQMTFLIKERLIYKDTSSLQYSHLIRSDVPKNQSLYRALWNAYYGSEKPVIILKLKEVSFEKNQ